jgi:hypothetical protein
MAPWRRAAMAGAGAPALLAADLQRPRALAEDVHLSARGQVKGKNYRVDPDLGSTLTVSNRNYQSNCWVNWKIMGQPCDFQVSAAASAARRGAAHVANSARPGLATEVDPLEARLLLGLPRAAPVTLRRTRVHLVGGGTFGMK